MPSKEIFLGAIWRGEPNIDALVLVRNSGQKLEATPRNGSIH